MSHNICRHVYGNVSMSTTRSSSVSFSSVLGKTLTLKVKSGLVPGIKYMSAPTASLCGNVFLFSFPDS